MSLLNSPPSICVEYEISSKSKHLSFFIQNNGLKDDRCQHWQVSRITDNYCHQWIQHFQIVHYAKFRGKWLTSFPVPLFKDSQYYLYLIKAEALKRCEICSQYMRHHSAVFIINFEHIWRHFFSISIVYCEYIFVCWKYQVHLKHLTTCFRLWTLIWLFQFRSGYSQVLYQNR